MKGLNCDSDNHRILFKLIFYSEINSQLRKGAGLQNVVEIINPISTHFGYFDYDYFNLKPSVVLITP